MAKVKLSAGGRDRILHSVQLHSDSELWDIPHMPHTSLPFSPSFLHLPLVPDLLLFPKGSCADRGQEPKIPRKKTHVTGKPLHLGRNRVLFLYTVETELGFAHCLSSEHKGLRGCISPGL